jgi:hypothetical protein
MKMNEAEDKERKKERKKGFKILIVCFKWGLRNFDFALTIV